MGVVWRMGSALASKLHRYLCTSIGDSGWDAGIHCLATLQQLHHHHVMCASAVPKPGWLTCIARVDKSRHWPASTRCLAKVTSTLAQEIDQLWQHCLCSPDGSAFRPSPLLPLSLPPFPSYNPFFSSCIFIFLVLFSSLFFILTLFLLLLSFIFSFLFLLFLLFLFSFILYRPTSFSHSPFFSISSIPNYLIYFCWLYSYP